MQKRTQTQKKPPVKKKTTKLTTTTSAQIKRKKVPPKAKADVSGSETYGEKIRGGTPWIFGNKIRKPKINFPKFERRQLSIPMPSKALGLIVIYITLFILQTGIVYLIYKEPPALGAKSNGDAMFLYTSIHDSFIIEGIVASIVIFLASTGFLLLYQGSKYVYNRKMALRIIIFGLILIVVAFIALQYMIGVKVGNLKQ